jgi:hypothetical protein
LTNHELSARPVERLRHRRRAELMIDGELSAFEFLDSTTVDHAVAHPRTFTASLEEPS